MDILFRLGRRVLPADSPAFRRFFLSAKRQLRAYLLSLAGINAPPEGFCSPRERSRNAPTLKFLHVAYFAGLERTRFLILYFRKGCLRGARLLERYLLGQRRDNGAWN